jgi:hypothetical protein
MTLSPREEMESCIAFCIQSRTVKTDIIEKIPIVMPKSERNVLNLLTITELKAKIKPSLKSLKNILIWVTKLIRTKDTKSFNSNNHIY